MQRNTNAINIQIPQINTIPKSIVNKSISQNYDGPPNTKQNMIFNNKRQIWNQIIKSKINQKRTEARNICKHCSK